jgi:hypothetical protein
VNHAASRYKERAPFLKLRHPVSASGTARGLPTLSVTDDSEGETPPYQWGPPLLEVQVHERVRSRLIIRKERYSENVKTYEATAPG